MKGIALTQTPRALAAARRALERVDARGRRSVSGELRGHALTFTVAREPTWSVQVETLPLPVAIDILGRDFAALGASDLRLGDPAFDDSFLVDAAPEDLARAILDADLRQRILALAPERLSLTPGAVRLAKRYAWYFAEEDDIREAIDLAVTLAERANAACRAADAHALAAAHRGAPYRAAPDPTAAKQAALQRRDHVAAVTRRHKWRWNKRKAAVAIGTLLYLLYIGITVLLGP